jgi:hypothetical protein
MGSAALELQVAKEKVSMLKPLTLSLGLALALGMTSVSNAGGHRGAAPSPQDPVLASGQSAPATPCEQSAGGCDDILGGAKKHCSLFDLFKRKPKCYTYEWVLKKKRVRHGLFGLGDCSGTGGCGGEGLGSCDSCGGAIYPSSQDPMASPQGGAAPYAAPQYLGTSQTYGAGQTTAAGQITTAAPLAPAAVAAPAAAPTDPSLTPPPAPREEAAPAAPAVPEVPSVPGAPSIPDVPAAPAPPTADAGGLLYLSPAGN